MRQLDNADLSTLNTWRVGGRATRVFLPETERDLSAIAQLRQGRTGPVPVIGLGSNLLVDDAGVGGDVVLTSRLETDAQVDRGSRTLLVGAGYKLPKLSRLAARFGLGGLEFLSGIPGSLGGAIAMNAGTGGTQGPSIGEHVVWIEVFDPATGSVRRHCREELGFSYRTCRFLESGLLVVRSLIAAPVVAPPGELLDSVKSVQSQRRAKQPIGERSAGSVFLPDDDGLPAAIHIDAVGLRGARIGGAAISQKHANWIEAGEGCTAANIRGLIELVQDAVLRDRGVLLKREVHYFPSEARQVQI